MEIRVVCLSIIYVVLASKSKFNGTILQSRDVITPNSIINMETREAITHITSIDERGHNVISEQTIYVSQRTTSNNSLICGQEEQQHPCLTIEYAVKHQINSTNVTLYIEGCDEDGKQFTYRIKGELYSNRIKMIRIVGKVHKIYPIILSDSCLLSHISAEYFVLEKLVINSCIDLYQDNLNQTKTYRTVHLKNSTLYGKQLFSGEVHNLNMTLEDCFIDRKDAFIISLTIYNNSMLTITNTTMKVNNNILVSPSYQSTVVLAIKHSYLYNGKIEYICNGMCNAVFISEVSKFYNSKMLFRNTNVTIDTTLFDITGNEGQIILIVDQDKPVMERNRTDGLSENYYSSDISFSIISSCVSRRGDTANSFSHFSTLLITNSAGRRIYMSLIKSNFLNTYFTFQDIHYGVIFDSTLTVEEKEFFPYSVISVLSTRTNEMKGFVITSTTFIGSFYGVTYFENVGQITIEKCTFVNNTFRDNDIQQYEGAAIVSTNTKSLSINGSLFLNNKASNGASTITSVSCDSYVTITNTLIKDVNINHPVISIGANGTFSNLTVQTVGVTKQISGFTMINLKRFRGMFLKINSPLNTYCPQNYNISVYFSMVDDAGLDLDMLLVRCTPCPKDKYSLDNGRFLVNSNMDTNNKIYNNKSNFYNKKLLHNVNYIQCQPCPPGGVCNENLIKSRDNYWGRRDNINITFYRCPLNYCCSGSTQPCTSYNTCNSNRNGTLCGDCLVGYSQDLFSERCIPNECCGSSYVFIILYCSVAVCFVFAILYVTEMFTFVKSVAKQIKELFNKTMDQLIRRGVSSDNLERLLPPTDLQQSEQHEKENSMSAEIVGFIKILFQYYQFLAIITLKTSTKSNTSSVFHNAKNFVMSLFTVKLSPHNSSNVMCFFKDLNMLEKQVIVSSPPLMCIFIFLLCFLINFIYQRQKHKRNQESDQEETGSQNAMPEQRLEAQNQLLDEDTIDKFESSNELEIINNGENSNQRNDKTAGPSSIPFDVRLKSGLVQIVLLSYQTVSLFLFHCVHCIEINSQHQLFIQASRPCNTWLQTISWIIITIWLLPFPFAVFFASRRLQKRQINPNQFLLTLGFPPALLFLCASNRNTSVENERVESLRHRILVIVNEPFRLYNKTFDILSQSMADNRSTIHNKFSHNNLCNNRFQKDKQDNSSSGNLDSTSNERMNWEFVIILRKLSLTIVYIFLINPVPRLIMMQMLLVAFLVHQCAYNPFRDDCLNRLETLSFAVITIVCGTNIFWAFTALEYYTEISQTSLYLESVALMLPFLLLIIQFCNYVRRNTFCKKKRKEVRE